MRSFNHIVLLGTTAADPEVLSTKNGKMLASFPLAIDRNWPENVGETKRETDFHRIITWGKLAEICEKYVQKGLNVLISGTLVTHCYESKDGSKRYTTEIHASRLEIVTPKSVRETKNALKETAKK